MSHFMPERLPAFKHHHNNRYGLPQAGIQATLENHTNDHRHINGQLQDPLEFER